MVYKNDEIEQIDFFKTLDDDEDEEMFQSFELDLANLEQGDEANLDSNYSFGGKCHSKTNMLKT
jgi:hypothetical protein